MDGRKLVSLMEHTHGGIFDPSDDWTPREIAWQLSRSAQLGVPPERMNKQEVIAFSKKFIREELLRPIIESIGDEQAAIVKNLAIGLVNKLTLNAEAIRAPNGDPVILFNIGILQITSYWWEAHYLLSRAVSSRDETARTSQLLEIYSFLLLLIKDNGRITYPQPSGNLSEDEMAAILSRSMQVELFILAHEIAHILLDHPLITLQPGRQESWTKDLARQDQLSADDELHADIVGYQIYLETWPKCRISRSDLTVENLLAPLEYFAMMQLVEKNPEVVPEYGQSSSHPSAAKRADMLMRLILYSHGGPEAAPEIAAACTQAWQVLQSMPNLPEAFVELAESAGFAPTRKSRKEFKKWKRSQ